MSRDAVETIKKLDALIEKGVAWSIFGDIQRPWGLAIAGERDRTLQIMEEIGRSDKRESLGTLYDFTMACVLAAKGDPRDREEAFRYLENSVAEPHAWSLTYDVEPCFDSLRSDPRFAAIIKKAGFPIE